MRKSNHEVVSHLWRPVRYLAASLMKRLFCLVCGLLLSPPVAHTFTGQPATAPLTSSADVLLRATSAAPTAPAAPAVATFPLTTPAEPPDAHVLLKAVLPQPDANAAAAPRSKRKSKDDATRMNRYFTQLLKAAHSRDRRQLVSTLKKLDRDEVVLAAQRRGDRDSKRLQDALLKACSRCGLTDYAGRIFEVSNCNHSTASCCCSIACSALDLSSQRGSMHNTHLQPKCFRCCLRDS
jgi:hypothetical protein